MKPLEIKLEGFEKVDLESEYEEALKDPIFKKIVSKLKMKDEELCLYTSMFEDSVCEYKNCLECQALSSCKNRIKGHVYIPVNKEGTLQFQYKSCKYYDKMKKNTKFLEKIKYYNTPVALQEATMSKINKNDKNRFDAILWVNNFYKEYKKDNHIKGLYLYGNFGCGKTYMIAALFNDLAREGYESTIIFWPEFIRNVFSSDFNERYEQVKNSPLLLIDDIGAEQVTSYNRDEVLCPLLQHRMDEKLPTFFTSNLNIEQLEELLSDTKQGVDSVKAARIVARIKQLTDSKELISKNLRK